MFTNNGTLIDFYSFARRETSKNELRKKACKLIKTNYFGKKASKIERAWIASRYVDLVSKSTFHTGNNGERWEYKTPSQYALKLAKLHDAFTTLERAGLVELEWVPDEFCSIQELKGDGYNKDVNSDIRPSILKRQEKAFEEQVEREGVWGLVGKFWNPVSQKFERADSCFGFVGQDAHDYEHDIKAATIDAVKGNKDLIQHLKTALNAVKG